MKNMFKKVLLSTMLLVSILFLQACEVRYHTYVPAQYEYPELATAPEGGVEGLTNYLVKNYTNEEDKVKIIYLWILQNVDSNSSRRSSSDWEHIYYSDRGVANSFAYANLFAKMLNIAGIKNNVTYGLRVSHNYEKKLQDNATLRNVTIENYNLYIKNEAKLSNEWNDIVEACKNMNDELGGYESPKCKYDANSRVIWHNKYAEPGVNALYKTFYKKSVENNKLWYSLPTGSWNIVFIDNKPYMFDLMLSDKDTEGYNYDYYKISPDKFINNHFPVDEKYQYLDKAMSVEDFVGQFAK